MTASTPISIDFIMPDLGFGAARVCVSLWLVEVGVRVAAGDRLLEIAAAGVTVDLSSPASGVLRKVFVCEEDLLQPGQRLGVIEVEAIA